MPPSTEELQDPAPSSNRVLDLLRGWRLFRDCAAIGLVLAVSAVLIIGKHYTTEVSFVPQGSRSGQLRGLAAQFGFNVAVSEIGEPPFFHVDLVHTNEVLTRVVSHPYDDGEHKGDYATMRDITEADSALRTWKAIRALDKKLRVSADRRTGAPALSPSP